MHKEEKLPVLVSPLNLSLESGVGNLVVAIMTSVLVIPNPWFLHFLSQRWESSYCIDGDGLEGWRCWEGGHSLEVPFWTVWMNLDSFDQLSAHLVSSSLGQWAEGVLPSLSFELWTLSHWFCVISGFCYPFWKVRHLWFLLFSWGTEECHSHKLRVIVQKTRYHVEQGTSCPAVSTLHEVDPCV